MFNLNRSTFAIPGLESELYVWAVRYLRFRKQNKKSFAYNILQNAASSPIDFH